jgi:anti-sigma factor RsiW
VRTVATARKPNDVAGAVGSAAQPPAWVRLVRLAATGLAAGAVAGFLAALLRPRRWIEYAQPRLVGRP